MFLWTRHVFVSPERGFASAKIKRDERNTTKTMLLCANNRHGGEEKDDSELKSAVNRRILETEERTSVVSYVSRLERVNKKFL